MTTNTTTTKIAELNDRHRKLGNYEATQGVRALKPKQLMELIELVQNFDNFTSDNDPWEEHDLVAVEYNDERFFWKIDYYDLDFKYRSEDPADETKTRRVSTLMLADEY